jgi:short-subunit dehydrogenase
MIIEFTREKSNPMNTLPAVLITGASTGIGATYAERFARRGHDLVLVARDVARMNALADRLRQEAGVAVDIIQADLTQPADLATVETRLSNDARIGILVNNAGTAIGGTFTEQSIDDVTRLVALNTTALLRLASAIAPRLAKAGKGSIVNIGSVVGLAPEFGMTVYGATKALRPVPVSRAQPRAWTEGRLRPGRASGHDPNRNLGACRRRCQHFEQCHGGR